MPAKSTNLVKLYTAFARAISDARAPWAVVAIIALALISTGCSLDRERLAKTRADLVEICEGAITIPLKMACERAGISTKDAEVVGMEP